MLAATCLSFAALILATILIDGPRSFLGLGDGWSYFLIGIVLNAPRFLLLGVAVGYLCKRVSGSE